MVNQSIDVGDMGDRVREHLHGILDDGIKELDDFLNWDLEEWLR